MPEPASFAWYVKNEIGKEGGRLWEVSVTQ